MALGIAAAAVMLTGVATLAARPHRAAAPPPPPVTALTPRAQPTPATQAAPPPRRSHRRVSRPSAPAHPIATATSLSTFWGLDVSWPQCDSGIPPTAAAFVIVGVNDGRPFTTNPCLAEQAQYAAGRSGVAAYLNIDAPRGGDPAAYGARAALDGLARLAATGLHPPALWLDVETLNYWTADPQVNLAVIAGAVRALRTKHVVAGVYSSTLMWQRIAGGADPGVPVWIATAVTDYRLLDEPCSQGLGGRAAALAQYVAGTAGQLIDVDVLCPATRADSVRLFAPGRG